MPGNNAWNGKWSGEGNLYAMVKTIPNTKAGKAKLESIVGSGAIQRNSFGYSFGDGWFARVEARVVDSGSARMFRTKSKGFCGYEWMVDSILKNGKILAN